MKLFEHLRCYHLHWLIFHSLEMHVSLRRYTRATGPVEVNPNRMNEPLKFRKDFSLHHLFYTFCIFSSFKTVNLNFGSRTNSLFYEDRTTWFPFRAKIYFIAKKSTHSFGSSWKIHFYLEWKYVSVPIWNGRKKVYHPRIQHQIYSKCTFLSYWSLQLIKLCQHSCKEESERCAAVWFHLDSSARRSWTIIDKRIKGIPPIILPTQFFFWVNIFQPI